MDQVSAFLLHHPPHATKRPRNSGSRGGGDHSSAWSENELESLLAAQERLPTEKRVEFASRIAATFEDHRKKQISFSQLVRKTGMLAKQIREHGPGRRKAA